MKAETGDGNRKSLDHRVSKAFVGDVLDWMEDAYALFTVRLFDASLSRQHANPKKIYAVDHALVRSTSTGIVEVIPVWQFLLEDEIAKD